MNNDLIIQKALDWSYGSIVVNALSFRLSDVQRITAATAIRTGYAKQHRTFDTTWHRQHQHGLPSSIIKMALA